MPLEWVSQFIGIPFRPYGRGHDGCDCYGLLRLVLAERFGKVLPTFGEGYDDFSDREVEARLIDEHLPLIGAARVEEPEPGDIVLLRILGHASHVGVYTGEGFVLHTIEGRGTCLDSLRAPALRSRIEGFYHVD